jgi:hypothetical protein
VKNPGITKPPAGIPPGVFFRRARQGATQGLLSDGARKPVE